MKVIIVGEGPELEEIIKTLLEKKMNVTVLDHSPSFIDEITTKYNVNGVIGDILYKTSLTKAGIATCDIFIALTSSNSGNVLGCFMAKSMGAKYTLARTKHFEIQEDIRNLSSKFKIDLLIDSDYVESQEIVRLIQFPNILNNEVFNSGATVVEVLITPESNLINVPLKKNKMLQKSNILICTVQHEKEVYIPHGNSIIYNNDRVLIAGEEESITKFLTKIKVIKKPCSSVLIVGGGKVGVTTSLLLTKLNIKPTIVENDLQRCQELLHLSPKSTILKGSGTDSKFLESLKINKYDAMICASGSDETNLVTAIYGKGKGVSKIITEIEDQQFSSVLHEMNIQSTISSSSVTKKMFFNFIYGIQNKEKLTLKGEVKQLFNLTDTDTFAIEFEVNKTFPLLGVQFKNSRFSLKRDTLIASIIRNGSVIIPRGTTCLRENDTVIIITKNKKINKLRDIIE